ncbi:GGDEF domain-containing protein [Aliidiomarina minuta]|uniref:diguanylate cyclase n=1 Tax=Aliidiomarina minuta TaxID=880057 RepID=A0A432W5Y8_9GAMM|nr:GGDEF domain-containing protein [Aliidiomarina minuta]RUO25396.1 GGDEF domain-containing protein [Aliidiomarina minuta]
MTNTNDDSQLRQAYEGELKTLTLFINRLGNALRGIDVELDHKLTKIRSLSSGKPNLTKLRPLFDEVGNLLQKHSSMNERQIQEARENAKACIHNLKRTPDFSAEARIQLRDLLQQIDEPIYSLSQLLLLLNKVILLYRQYLPHQTESSSVQAKEQLSSLQNELANLLSSIDFAGATSSALNTIRQQLMGELGSQQLLHNSMDILRLIIRGISEERQSAQQFLHSLNDALSSLAQVLDSSMKTSENASEEQNKYNQQLQQQLNKLSASIKESDEIQQLKQQTKMHVELLSTTLFQKSEAEASAQQQLRRQLLSMQARLEDVESEAQMYKRRLSEQTFKSLQDSLTRLPNRAAFEERLQLEYQRWQSYAAALTIAVVDIDNFKVINDNYGHIAGDKTLQVIANMLKKSLRDTDFVCRYGGEEFVILFPQTSVQQATELLDKSRSRIKNIPFRFKNKNISITISAGVADFGTEDSKTTVFERADSALYQAKKQGRDRVCYQ